MDGGAIRRKGKERIRAGGCEIRQNASLQAVAEPLSAYVHRFQEAICHGREARETTRGPRSERVTWASRTAPFLLIRSGFALNRAEGDGDGAARGRNLYESPNGERVSRRVQGVPNPSQRLGWRARAGRHLARVSAQF